MKRHLYTLITIAALSSCSPYQKVLKSDAVAPKFKLGMQLYNAGKYSKASALFEQIVPKYRGKPQGEKLMFLYANAFYNTHDYYTAAYQFERFVSNYPKSQKAEEAAFLAIKCHYQRAPKYSKDQTETTTAIDKIQAFIDAHPESKYLEKANNMMQKLEYKLERKAFSIAKQYDLISQYQASITSMDNFIFDFPGSTLREDALFYKLDAASKLATNSVEYKKQNRLETAKTYYDTFVETYKNSKYTAKAHAIKTLLDDQLKHYKTNTK